jgi:lipopolysaccharide transport system ATP-binding protein
MSDIAIRVENLGKQYKIGRLQKRHDTLRDQISDVGRRILEGGKRKVESGNSEFCTPNSEILNPNSDMIWALRDVSFEVKRGEVVGIIGRNGAGKSTLLKILSRITEPTTGAVDLYGRVASLLEVGTGFHPELTGRENIFLNGAILGMRKTEIEKKFDEIVAFAEVEKFIDTPVKRYSSGMYVRLAFAVAAHLEPEILLVDEVLAVGDAAFQKKCLGKMGDVAREGRTVLFVSHNMAAITGLTSHCIYVRSGILAEIGTTSNVVDIYLSETIHESQQREGFCDLRGVKRGTNIVNSIAQFEWVRTLDKAGNQKARFIKRRPFVIEVGYCLSSPTRELQFGFGVKHDRSGAEVFISPSPVYEGEFNPGQYIVNLPVEPNYLHPGLYSVVLKMFCGGRRQDTIGDTASFEVIEDPAVNKDEIFTDRWVQGLVDIEFKWPSQPARFD